MPRPAPLHGPISAANTLAHRLSPLADRLRHLHTRFGLRSYRVFLVWTRWNGEERGEGAEEVIAAVELLPTPRITDLGALSRRPFSAGVFPEGSIRVDQISASAYTEDILRGLRIPTGAHVGHYRPNSTPVQTGTPASELTTDPKVDFWWELQEDGRGDSPALRRRFRVFGGPARKEGSLYWAVGLELADEARRRDGAATQIGINPSLINDEE